jgi:hypothetical protein
LRGTSWLSFEVAMFVIPVLSYISWDERGRFLSSDERRYFRGLSPINCLYRSNWFWIIFRDDATTQKVFLVLANSIYISNNELNKEWNRPFVQWPWNMWVGQTKIGQVEIIKDWEKGSDKGRVVDKKKGSRVNEVDEQNSLPKSNGSGNISKAGVILIL